MPGPLEGIKVVELASWMFVPSAGTVLVDWGADVIKVEHPVTGDPQRGLVTSGLLPGGDSGINFMMEQPNRGKRSVAIDLSRPDGREAFMRLVEGADVFLTNYLPPVRRKLRVEVDDVRARNARIVVARGSGQGPKGPDAEKGGYDAASFWARGGVGAVMPTNAEGWPSGQPGGQHLPDGRRPVHQPGAAATRQVLGRPGQAPRAPRAHDRRALQHRCGPGAEHRGVRGGARRRLRVPTAGALEAGPGRLRRCVDAVPDAGRALQRPAGHRQRVPSGHGGAQRPAGAAGGESRPVRRAPGGGEPRARAR